MEEEMGFQGSFTLGKRGIFNVAPDGALRWYKYSGNGEQDPAGGAGWLPNSGNQIGQGWSGGFRTFLGRGREIFAVGEDGSLRWYRYVGSGELDPTGINGNWRPNSGNQIGQGWSGGFRTFFGGGEIFAVGEDGSLRWYRYEGSGELDPDGSTGRWHPNSGNQIGQGWSAGFRAFFSTPRPIGPAPDSIFAVGDDGSLRWYAYDGEGELDPDGSNGNWVPNSGNQIGRGWT
jgi:tachylectin